MVAAALALWTPMPKAPPPEEHALLVEAVTAKATDLVLACCLNLAACRLKQGKPYEAIAACEVECEVGDVGATFAPRAGAHPLGLALRTRRSGDGLLGQGAPG